MADNDQASKTEDATPKKLEDARKKGDVAKSPDVASWLSLAAASGVIIVGGGLFMRAMAEALLPFVASPHELIGSLETGGATEIFRNAVLATAPLLAAVMLATMVGGAAGNLVQHGLLWTTEKMKPKWSKVSPIQGFKRIFGPDGLVQFLKTFIKLVAVCWIAWTVLKSHAREFETMAALSPAAILPVAQDLIVALMAAVLAFLGVTSAADWLWQRYRHAQKMKMSREEVKDEYKQSEGDPHVKARLRQIRMERSRRRMMAAVPQATLIVTNPTHYAVALRYVAGETPAPVCLAKGVDAVALKIREIGGQHDVPIVEDPPLARALYAAVDIDETIPREHYEAVARLISFVMGPRPASGGARRFPR